jgi:hypothetical protein
MFCTKTYESSCARLGYVATHDHMATKTTQTEDPKPELPNVPFRNVLKVENNTAAVIVLAATQNFPMGFVLKPGINDALQGEVMVDLPDGDVQSVPVKYFDELFAYKAVDINDRTWYPGRRQIAELEKPVRYTTSRGDRVGPRITIYSTDQVAKPGAGIPESLDDYWKEYRDDQDDVQNVALQMLAVISDRAALARYAKHSKHNVIKQMAQAKLNGLG